MSAKAQETGGVGTPALKVIEGGRAARKAGRPEVVAEILGDGTVRLVSGEGRGSDRGFAVGNIAGDGWTMWWERRDW